MKNSSSVIPNLTNDEAEKFVKDILLTKKPLTDIDFTNDLAKPKKNFYGEKTTNGKGPRRKYQLALGNLKRVSNKRWNSILENLGLKDLHDSLELGRERARREAEESGDAEGGNGGSEDKEESEGEEGSEGEEESEGEEVSETEEEEGSETEEEEEPSSGTEKEETMSATSEAEMSSVTGSFGKMSMSTPPRTQRISRKSSKTPPRSSAKKKTTKPSPFDEPTKSTLTLLDELVQDGHEPVSDDSVVNRIG